jgi:HSP20 family protein
MHIMKLIRWSPSPLRASQELAGFQDEVNQLFDSFFTRGALRGDVAASFAPPVDVFETPEEYVLRADLPGVSQKDVKVSLMGDTLTLRGERKQESASKNGGVHRVERICGTFERSFTLGSPVRSDQVKAQVKDGVLEIRVPKADEAKLREIEVQVA